MSIADEIQAAKVKLEQQLQTVPGFMEYLGLIALEKTYRRGKEIHEASLGQGQTDRRVGENLKRVEPTRVAEIRDEVRELVLTYFCEEPELTSPVIMTRLRKRYKILRKRTTSLCALLGKDWLAQNHINREHKTYRRVA